ncbi:uncharacterized protein LOC106871196 isoform X2 [Octopus bimaculoides]|nr:uncharacterized protein LOC106871196 isoform X2 [Octopus bimaculoides]|eukprot:XP_014773028.1 PREDICTED: uncharacterized protein LOC106871196 isoform X2 [Octopus bimaculoides]
MQEQNRGASVVNVGRIIFTNFEKNILRELVDEHREILECKKNDWRSIKMKTETWNAIADEFNSQPGVNRKDCKQLKKCWENMKARAKKALNKDIIEIPRFVEELENQVGSADAVTLGVPTGSVGITGVTITGTATPAGSGGSIKVEPVHNRLYVEADHPYVVGGGHGHAETSGGASNGGGGTTPGGSSANGNGNPAGNVTPSGAGGNGTTATVVGVVTGGTGHINNNNNHTHIHNHSQAHIQNNFTHQSVTVLECPDDDDSPPPTITVPVSGGPVPTGIFPISNGDMCSPNSMLAGGDATTQAINNQVVLVKMQQEQHEMQMLMMKRKLDYAAAEHKAKMDVFQIQRQYWALQ